MIILTLKNSSRWMILMKKKGVFLTLDRPSKNLARSPRTDDAFAPIFSMNAKIFQNLEFFQKAQKFIILEAHYFQRDAGDWIQLTFEQGVQIPDPDGKVGDRGIPDPRHSVLSVGRKYFYKNLDFYAELQLLYR